MTSQLTPLDPLELSFFQTFETKSQLKRQQQAKEVERSLPPSQITCINCQRKQVTYAMQQHRSSDEGLDADFRCNHCGMTWKQRT